MPSPSPASWSYLATLIIVCTLGGYLFMNCWQRDVTATEAGLIYCIEPVITSVLALFLPYLSPSGPASAIPMKPSPPACSLG